MEKILDESVRRVGKDLGGFCFPERNGGGVYSADNDDDRFVDLLHFAELQYLSIRSTCRSIEESSRICASLTARLECRRSSASLKLML